MPSNRSPRASPSKSAAAAAASPRRRRPVPTPAPIQEEQDDTGNVGDGTTDTPNGSRSFTAAEEATNTTFEKNDSSSSSPATQTFTPHPLLRPNGTAVRALERACSAAPGGSMANLYGVVFSPYELGLTEDDFCEKSGEILETTGLQVIRLLPTVAETEEDDSATYQEWACAILLGVVPPGHTVAAYLALWSKHLKNLNQACRLLGIAPGTAPCISYAVPSTFGGTSDELWK